MKYSCLWLSPILSFVLLCCPACYGARALQQAVSSQRNCDTPLIVAIHKRNDSEARKLIREKADLSVKACEEGETPLGEAIAQGQTDIAKEIILAGANVNIADNKGTSPLMYASFYCEEDVVSLLVKHGANVNATDSDGTSALMNAAYQCKSGSIVAVLLRSRANVNSQSNTGDTALILAVVHADEFAVKELVAAGADLKLKTKEGKTALDVAMELAADQKPEHQRIYTFLRTASES
jgi:ankyrin repeat protein